MLGCFGLHYEAGLAVDISVWFRLWFTVFWGCYSNAFLPSLHSHSFSLPYNCDCFFWTSFFDSLILLCFGCMPVRERHRNTLVCVFRACWHTVFGWFEVWSLLMSEIESWSGIRRKWWQCEVEIMEECVQNALILIWFCSFICLFLTVF